MEKKLIAGIFLFFLFINLYPFLHGLKSTPSNFVFLGTVHYPIDYLYYLSHITQGEDHILRTQYISTTEPIPNLFLGSVYVLLGKIGHILNISPIIMYQIGLFFFGLLFLLGAYCLITKVFPDSTEKRIAAFLLFMFSNTLPRLVEEGGKTVLAPYFSWYNYGEPFLRLSAVPHHLLIQAAIFFTLLSVINYQHRKNALWLATISISSVILANMQPVQWVLLFVGISVFILFYGIFFNRKPHILIPLFCFLLIGIPIVLYMNTMFAREPFVSIRLWEAAQSPILLRWQFIQYHGIVFLLGIAGMPFFLKTNNLYRILIAIISGISLFMFLLPHSRTLSILTFRYLSSVPILLYASCAVTIISMLSKAVGKFGPFIKGASFTALFFLLVPLFFVQMQSKLAVFTPSSYIDPNIFLHRDVYQLFLQARKISTNTDTFIVFPPYQSAFQAVAGRRQYAVTNFSTIDFNRKMEEVYLLLDKTRPENDHIAFLKKNNITYIIANTIDDMSSYSFLKEVARNDHVRIYQITI
jgi:hypothetical protein